MFRDTETFRYMEIIFSFSYIKTSFVNHYNILKIKLLNM